MGYYSLPMSRSNVDIPNEYLYLSISKYPDTYFQPESGKKRLTKEERASKEKNVKAHEKTVELLDSGRFNAYNCAIELSSILGTFSSKLEDYSKTTLYRIKPLSSKSDSAGYSKRYYAYEFEVVNKICSQQELEAQLIKDHLIKRYAAEVFSNYCYGNDGYSDMLINWFSELHKNNPDIDISLSDIVLTADYHHEARDKFRSNSYYTLTGYNLRKLIEDNLISYTNEYDYYKSEVIRILLNCGLYDIALPYIKLETRYKENLAKDKELEKALRLHSDNDTVIEIIDYLDIKLSGVTLSINKNVDGYNDYDYKYVKFETVDEAKSFLIKEYDIPFSKLSKPDISEFTHYDGDSSYTFTIA